MVLACSAFAKFVPFSVRWSSAFLNWSCDRLDFPFQLSAVFLRTDHPVCSLEPVLESTNRIKIRIFSTVVLKIISLVCLRVDALQTVSMPGFSTLDIILWVCVGYPIFIKFYFLNLVGNE